MKWCHLQHFIEPSRKAAEGSVYEPPTINGEKVKVQFYLYVNITYLIDEQIHLSTFFTFNLSLIGTAPVPELTKDFWNSPEFVRSFMGDYGFRTDIEPKVTSTEQSVLRK